MTWTQLFATSAADEGPDTENAGSHDASEFSAGGGAEASQTGDMPTRPPGQAGGVRDDALLEAVQRDHRMVSCVMSLV